MEALFIVLWDLTLVLFENKDGILLTIMIYSPAQLMFLLNVCFYYFYLCMSVW